MKKDRRAFVPFLLFVIEYKNTFLQSSSTIRLVMLHVEYVKDQCRTVEFIKGQCRPVGFEKGQSLSLKNPMLLGPRIAHVALLNLIVRGHKKAGS